MERERIFMNLIWGSLERYSRVHFVSYFAKEQFMPIAVTYTVSFIYKYFAANQTSNRSSE